MVCNILIRTVVATPMVLVAAIGNITSILSCLRIYQGKCMNHESTLPSVQGFPVLGLGFRVYCFRFGVYLNLQM